MSTAKERADARHELPRQRERELVAVVKAAQDAANATTDAELTRKPLGRALELALAALGLRMPEGNGQGADN